MPCLPPMTGNGWFIPPIKMVMTGGWFMIVLTTLISTIIINHDWLYMIISYHCCSPLKHLYI